MWLVTASLPSVWMCHCSVVIASCTPNHPSKVQYHTVCQHLHVAGCWTIWCYVTRCMCGGVAGNLHNSTYADEFCRNGLFIIKLPKTVQFASRLLASSRAQILECFLIHLSSRKLDAVMEYTCNDSVADPPFGDEHRRKPTLQAYFLLIRSCFGCSSWAIIIYFYCVHSVYDTPYPSRANSEVPT